MTNQNEFCKMVVELQTSRMPQAGILFRRGNLLLIFNKSTRYRRIQGPILLYFLGNIARLADSEAAQHIIKGSLMYVRVSVCVCV